MQVIEQGQGDDQAVRHRDRTHDGCTRTGHKFVRDTNTTLTRSAGNVGPCIAVRVADAVRIGTRVADRIRIAHQP